MCIDHARNNESYDAKSNSDGKYKECESNYAASHSTVQLSLLKSVGAMLTNEGLVSTWKYSCPHACDENTEPIVLCDFDWDTLCHLLALGAYPSFHLL